MAKARKLRPPMRTSQSLRFRSMLPCCFFAVTMPVYAQEKQVEAPVFRARTDASALQDVDAVREKLKRIIDARGPINPLADYVRPSGDSDESLPKPAEPPKRRVADEEDTEATRAPSLNADAQRRLKAQPPTISPTELSIIGLYPPPQIVSNSARPMLERWTDDGFRPSSLVTTAAWTNGTEPMNGTVSFPIVSEGWPVTANYMQNDPAAMIPPTLGNSPLGSPAFGNTGTLPPANLNPAPSSNLQGQGTVLPAPPSYIVPNPTSNPYASPAMPPPGTIMPPGSTFVPGSGLAPGSAMAPGRAGATMPYSDVMPSYSRSGTFVNNAPFVSAPPQAKDARWMVSPEVYRRASGEVCGPMGGVAGVPVAGAPTGTASPFIYAPPVSMPPQTASSSWHSSLLHPFRHMSRHFHR